MGIFVRLAVEMSLCSRYNCRTCTWPRMTNSFHKCDKEINLLALWSHFSDNAIFLCQTVCLCLCTYTCSLMAYFRAQPKPSTIKTVSLQSSLLFLACVMTEAFAVISVLR